MYCRNHPDRDAAAVCQKHAVGFCRVRTQCIIREISRERRKGKTLIAACSPDEQQRFYPE